MTGSWNDLSNSQILGNEGNDTIDCGTDMGGGVRIDGGDGADTLKGGFGDDDITGGPGADSMWGGDGDDVFHANDGSNLDIIEGGLGQDEAWIDIPWERQIRNVEFIHGV